jgi:hypothetical protein
MSIKEKIILSHKRTILRELLRRTTITSDGHYLWNGAKTGDGYGEQWIEGKTYRVHRLSAYIYLGLNLEDITQQALHKNTCPYKNCWSKDCLYVGTHRDNMDDLKASYGTISHFNCGCERTEENTYHMGGRTRCKSCYTRYDRRRRVRERRRKQLKKQQSNLSATNKPLFNPFAKTEKGSDS